MAVALQERLQTAATSASVRALLITGSGRAFCAGQDIAEFSEITTAPDLGEIIRTGCNPIVRLIRTIEKPVVCAVNGVAAGAGANLALCCDLVLAAESASFVQAFSKIGLIPDFGGSFFLPRLVGFARANALALLGDKLAASDALEMGLIYRVCPDAALMEEARALAERLAREPTRGIGLTKRAFNASLANSLEQQLALEEQLQAEAGRTQDFLEGVQAFFQKRKPQFKGA
jgi:2-(1,2-epoxy-1,2-dihydrophenyl)acetyl-CoA isomerase